MRGIPPSSLSLSNFAGTDDELGFQQGKEYGALIREGLHAVYGIEDLKKAKPALLPNSLFMAIAKRRLSRPVWEDVLKYHPGKAERFRALADGAGVGLRDVMFLQALEMLFMNPRSTGGGCTALAFGPEATATHEPIVAKNFDYLPLLGPYQIACVTNPKGGNRSLGFKMAPLCGTLDGMNEHGLTILYNLAFSNDRADCHVPMSVLIQEMLERFSATSEAVEYVMKAKLGGHSAVLTVADRGGDMRAVEITPQHVAALDKEEGRVIRTNHYLSAEMQRCELPKDTVVSDASSGKGVRLFESSERRYERVKQLIPGFQTVDEARIVSVLRDHGPDSYPSRNTICMHTPTAATMRSMIFYPRRRMVKALHGNPCQNEYTELVF